MPINAGDIIRVMAHFTSPPKLKFLICICPQTFRYMVINTDPYLLAAAAQLAVSTTDIPALKHASHIDTSKLLKLSKLETADEVQKDPRCHRGALSAAMKQKIGQLVQAHGIMQKDQEQLLLTNFGVPQAPVAAPRKPRIFGATP